MKNIINACVIYKLNMQRFPAELKDLTTVPVGISRVQWGGPYVDAEDYIVDPWGTQFSYSADESSNVVTIKSAGPDKKFGTDDDITTDK